MVDSFDCLRHDVIVSCHDDNTDVGNLGSTSTHSGEGFVTRSVKEGYMTAILKSHAVRSDMLSDTTCFTCDNISMTDVIEQ